jgi:hypothetical protein
LLRRMESAGRLRQRLLWRQVQVLAVSAIGF